MSDGASSGAVDEWDELPPSPRAVRSPLPARMTDTDDSEEDSASSPLTMDEFLDHLVDSGLMMHDEVASLVAEISPEFRPTDANQLARELVRQHKLTRFQVGALKRHKPRPLIFGEYVLLDKIGAGGMGQVFKARHRKMHRTVALKLLPPHVTLNRRAIRRFEHEAAAAAQIEHEGIVTVYDVGEAHDQPFFTMRYVDGCSLSDVLRNGPVDNRQAAGYLEPVARAVQEAHQHGILHRDLKPQNILIDGKTGQTLVADFGLAKLIEEEEEALTRSGEVMGTPSYMAPEQACDAARVSTLTDVYALGATLYHLLTGRPPFQAATPVETLRQVIDQEPVPLRQLNGAVDRDLETICLKCVEKDPGRRYISSADVADELRRVLNGEPIRARPVGQLTRAWKWCRRNKLVASLGTAAVTFLIAALVATTVGYVTTKAARQRAEAGFREARGAVNDFFTRVSEETLLNQPGMQPLKEDLLRKALDYYQRFLDQRGSDPGLQDEVAAIMYRVGLITEQIEGPQQALEWLQRARRMQTELLESHPDSTERLEALGKTWTAEGNVLATLPRLDDALDAHQQTLRIRSQLADAHPNRREFQRTLANTLMNIGIIQKNIASSNGESGRFQSAFEHMTRSQEIRGRLLASQPDDWPIVRDYARGHYNLGNLAGLSEVSVNSTQHFAESRQALLRLVDSPARNLDDSFRLVVCTRLLADQAEQVDTAFSLYEEAIRYGEPLALRNPDVNDYQMELARILLNRGVLLIDVGRRSDAIESLGRSRSILRTLLGQSPRRPSVRHDLAYTLQLIGELHLGQQRLDEARASLSESRSLLDSLATDFPDRSDFRATLVQTQDLLGRLNKLSDPMPGQQPPSGSRSGSND